MTDATTETRISRGQMSASARREARNLAVDVCRRVGEFQLDAAFEAPPGITILFGASGAGKTATLDCIAGLVEPDAGHIVIGDRVLFDSAQHVSLRPEQRGVGYVFQDLALFPHLTVAQNVEFGLKHLDRALRGVRIEQMGEIFRIRTLLARKPGEISGGQRQRVALARSLAPAPSLLLLDEPLSALDAATKSDIIADLRAWNAAHRIPILYVTHSREEAFALGEQVVVLADGRVIAQGSPHQVLEAPQQLPLAQLAGIQNILDAVVLETHRDKGTMTCRIAGSPLTLEAPLARSEAGAAVRLGLLAGDILLATAPPQQISARNIVRGRIVCLADQDFVVTARVDCEGVIFEAHLTRGAREGLALAIGSEVWIVVKTHALLLLESGR